MQYWRSNYPNDNQMPQPTPKNIYLEIILEVHKVNE